MKRILYLALSAALLCGCAPTYSWQKLVADGSRTGVTAPNAENVTEALGSVDNGVYTAPNGVVFENGSTPEVAALMIGVQPSMASLKQVVGYCPDGMIKRRPESTLSNWAVDLLMAGVEETTGKKVDVGITNFGGIRCDMPQGEVLMDDIVSMFPFRNYAVYVSLKGWRLREIFEQMAKHNVEAIGGAKLVIKNRKLVSVTVGGEPLDDERTYGLATIDFLLKGGDNHTLGERVESIEVTDKLLVDIILPHVLKLQEEGQPIEYHFDGRVVIEK